MNRRIGFMQGRLSPPVDGRIQAFPSERWRDEFPAAHRLGFGAMEWTLDQDRLRDNPLMTPAGRDAIRSIAVPNDLKIPSVTGDCFMQSPFWKSSGPAREELLADFRAVVAACGALGVETIVMPLVDGGRLQDRRQEDDLVRSLGGERDRLAAEGVRIAFESDYEPADLVRFIARFDRDCFGINYDIGNSAALGFDPAREIGSYGDRIVGVHVKDRVRGGTTVPLGSGAADFDSAFAALARCGFGGYCILQTARAADGDDAGALARYAAMTDEWLTRYPVHAHAG